MAIARSSWSSFPLYIIIQDPSSQSTRRYSREQNKKSQPAGERDDNLETNTLMKIIFTSVGHVCGYKHMR